MIYQRIRYFLSAAGTGSFSKAAGQMYVSSQALTKQIGLLEQELGGKLFERSPQGVKLTGFGEYALEKLKKLDADFNDTMEELRIRARDHKVRMHIGIFSSLPQETLVTPIISFLLGAYPNYQISLDLVDLHEGRELLLNGKLDFFLTNTHEEDDWDDNRCLSFGEHEAKVIVSLLHPWAVKDQITIEDMKKETFLKMDMGAGHYTVQAEKSFYQNIPCKDIRKVGNFDTMYALLQQGNAFAVFPKAFAYMDQARIKYFDYPDGSLRFFTALIYNPHRSMHELDGVVEEIKEEFELKEIGIGTDSWQDV